MKTRIIIGIVLAFVLFAGSASAQTVVAKPGSLLEFDMSVDPVDYSFQLFTGTAEPIAITVQCAKSAAGWTCTTPLPALTPGQHELRILSSRTVDGTVFSASGPSEPLTVLTIIVEIPKNLRLRDGGGAD